MTVNNDFETVNNDFETVNNDFETVINPIGKKKCKIKILDLNKNFFIFYNSNPSLLNRCIIIKNKSIY